MFGPDSEPITVSRECPAILIPAGVQVSLPEGSSGYITQSLGGSFTVFVEGNLFLVQGQHADALGKQAVPPPSLPDDASDKDVEELVWSQLKSCYDPEIPVNIVDLGLVYDCELKSTGEEQRTVNVRMTLTAPGCGMGEVLVEDVRSKLVLIPTVSEADVELVFDPPWTFEMMSEEAKLQTGMF